MTLSSLNHAMNITVGVLALQGAFYEHIQLLKQATRPMTSTEPISWTFTEVRNGEQLAVCDALIIPGGESTTISLVAERSGLLGGLREFVKYEITDAVSMWELQC
jgi:pyridoxal 5'-phosphate synthase pdxT subunit